jgi:hypothetical protein
MGRFVRLALVRTEIPFGCEMMLGNPRHEKKGFPQASRECQRIRDFVITPHPVFGVAKRSVRSLLSSDPGDPPLSRIEKLSHRSARHDRYPF